MKTKLVLTCYCKCGKKFKNNILNSNGIDIEYTGNLRYVNLTSKNKNWSNQYLLAFVSKQITEKLISYGCVPNKSLILKAPVNLPFDLIRHFIRGYSDGDGSIGKKHFTLIGTRDVMEYINGYFKTFINTPYIVKQKKGENVCRLNMHRKAIVTPILDHIYEDAEFKMNRKYESYLNR